MKVSRNSMVESMIRIRRLAVAGMLSMALAACATAFEPADIKEAAHPVQPIEVSASRVDKDTIRPGRDIPQTLSPMVIFTSEDLYGTGYRDIGRALQNLSPFVGGGR
ncbi:MAG: hypothetical protein ACREVN_09560 [Gammaproteobacteria bacterium]